MSRSPAARACAHIAASERMVSLSRHVEGWSPSNTHPFRCFHNNQAVRCVAVASPLRFDFGMCCLTVSHHSLIDVSWSGAIHGILNQDSVSYQNCLEKGHEISEWCMVLQFLITESASPVVWKAASAQSFGSPTSVLVGEPKEEFNALWRTSFPNEIPSAAALRVSECGEVSWFGCVVPACCPSPYKLISLIWPISCMPRVPCMSRAQLWSWSPSLGSRL
jgi:hypothetical protein